MIKPSLVKSNVLSTVFTLCAGNRPPGGVRSVAEVLNFVRREKNRCHCKIVGKLPLLPRE